MKDEAVSPFYECQVGKVPSVHEIKVMKDVVQISPFNFSETRTDVAMSESR